MVNFQVFVGAAFHAQPAVAIEDGLSSTYA